MERWENKVAVVTGASSGIGEAIVKDLVEHGLRVIGLARRVERVEAIQEELSEEKRNMLLPLQCDVTDLESVNDAFDKIISEYGSVDILINNAGFMKFGQLISMDVSDIKQTVDTNILGVVYCTQRAVKSMMEENIAGHIIMINSVAGHVTVSHEGVQQTNIYGPSKYAITAMTEILRQEFKDLNSRIKVTSISPGAVDTDIIPDNFKEAFGENILKPEDISSAVVYAISTPAHVQIHEMMIRPVGELI